MHFCYIASPLTSPAPRHAHTTNTRAHTRARTHTPAPPIPNPRTPILDAHPTRTPDHRYTTSPTNSTPPHNQRQMRKRALVAHDIAHDIAHQKDHPTPFYPLVVLDAHSAGSELLQEVKKLKQESLKKKDKPLLSAHVVVKTGGAKVPFSPVRS